MDFNLYFSLEAILQNISFWSDTYVPFSLIKYHNEVMALGLTISKSIWLRCAYTLAILDGVENIVDDHQTFP